MTQLTDMIKTAHELATAAMAKAKADYVERIKAQGEEAWQRAVRNCGGERSVEPMYCGRASVIVPRKTNLALVNALKSEVERGAGTRWAGSATGYARKGSHTASDWSFYCPGEYGGQSMDIYEEGARVFLAHLQANGVVGAFMTSRAD